MRPIATLALIVAATWDVRAAAEVSTVVADAGWPAAAGSGRCGLRSHQGTVSRRERDRGVKPRRSEVA